MIKQLVIHCSSFLCCILFSNKVSDKCIVDVFQIDKEFMLISTVPLLSTFFAELDRHSPRMMEIFRYQSRAAGRKMRHLMVAISKVCIKMGRPLLIKYFLCPCHDNCMSTVLFTYVFASGLLRPKYCHPHKYLGMRIDKILTIPIPYRFLIYSLIDSYFDFCGSRKPT